VPLLLFSAGTAAIGLGHHCRSIAQMPLAPSAQDSAATRRLVPHDVRRRALEKLDFIAYATCLDDLRFPPGNRLEAR
jgi:hypothetical protein